MIQVLCCGRKRRSNALARLGEESFSHPLHDDWMTTPALLSTDDTQELFVTLVETAKRWIEEEQIQGNPVLFAGLLSNQAFTCVALHVPTTLNDLRSMGQFDPEVLATYGERIVRIVQVFVEKNNLKQVLWDDCHEVASSSGAPWPKLERKVPPCLLPKACIVELELLLEELSSRWANKEKRIRKKSKVELELISHDALKSIAFHAPATVEHLRAIGSLNDSIVRDHGDRLVLAVQMILTKNAMQNELGSTLLRQSVTFDVPLTPASSVESGLTHPSTPSSSFSGRSGSLEERSQEAAQELVDVLKVLALNWAEEERILTGKSVYCWDILSDESIKCIASHSPSSMAHLQSIWQANPEVMAEYGPRILAVINSVLERFEIESDDGEDSPSKNVDIDELEMSNKGSLMVYGSNPKAVLPEHLTRELFYVLKTLRKNWADEERLFLGRPVRAKDLISRDALQDISLRAPTTVEHLKKTGILKEDTVKEYGVRIVAVVQMFLEMREMNSDKMQPSRWERQEIMMSPDTKRSGY